MVPFAVLSLSFLGCLSLPFHGDFGAFGQRAEPPVCVSAAIAAEVGAEIEQIFEVIAVKC